MYLHGYTHVYTSSSSSSSTRIYDIIYDAYGVKKKTLTSSGVHNDE